MQTTYLVTEIQKNEFTNASERYVIGVFSNEQEAEEAREVATRRLLPEFVNTVYFSITAMKLNKLYQ